MSSTRGGKRPQRPPATTLEGREQQMVGLAMELAEERMRSGKASSQEIVHFLRLGSTRERLEQQRLANENVLTQAKIEALQSQARIEELYDKAIKAMRAYQGAPEEAEDA